LPARQSERRTNTRNDTLRYGNSNITVAGQTAPGRGITIAGTATKWTGSNVIVRNITVRPNLAPKETKNAFLQKFSRIRERKVVA
jgi:hypothetical protein